MLRTLADSCTDGQTCPAVYTDTDDPAPATVLVRGYLEQRSELERFLGRFDQCRVQP